MHWRLGMDFCYPRGWQEIIVSIHGRGNGAMRKEDFNVTHLMVRRGRRIVQQRLRRRRVVGVVAGVVGSRSRRSSLRGRRGCCCLKWDCHGGCCR